MKKIILSLLIITGSFFSDSGNFRVYAEVENLDYSIEKLTVKGIGKDVPEALNNAEINALELSISNFVQTAEEKSKYSEIRSQLIELRKDFVKTLKILGKSSTASGRELNVQFEISSAKLKEYLINSKVISPNQEIVKNLSFPKIMVFYEDRDKTEDDYSKFSVARVNNYLLAQKFSVVDEKTISRLKSEDKLLKNSQNFDNISRQRIALESKADIYMSIKIASETVGQSGNFVYVKAPVEIKAYESSSGSPFIVKTYQRLNKNGEEEALAVENSEDVSQKIVIEESVAGVMPMITNDLLLFWKNSISLGKQYILQIEGVNENEIQEIFSFLKDSCSDLKTENEQIIIRSKISLDEITDRIEKNFEERLLLESSNLGKAIFSKK